MTKARSIFSVHRADAERVAPILWTPTDWTRYEVQYCLGAARRYREAGDLGRDRQGHGPGGRDRGRQRGHPGLHDPRRRGGARPPPARGGGRLMPAEAIAALPAAGHWVVNIQTARGWRWGGVYHATEAEASEAAVSYASDPACWEVWITHYVAGQEVDKRAIKAAANGTIGCWLRNSW